MEEDESMASASTEPHVALQLLSPNTDAAVPFPGPSASYSLSGAPTSPLSSAHTLPPSSVATPPPSSSFAPSIVIKLEPVSSVYGEAQPITEQELADHVVRCAHSTTPEPIVNPALTGESLFSFTLFI